MDISALPDVFVRELMKCMNFKDRLSMRLTSRAFEELVAGSKSVHFDRGSIACRRNKLLLLIGDDIRVDEVEATEDVTDQILRLRNRLFNGVGFREFTIYPGDTLSAVEFISEFTKNLKTEILVFDIGFDSEYSETMIDSAFTLLADISSTRIEMRINSVPEIDQLKKMKEFSNVKYFISTNVVPPRSQLLALPLMEEFAIRIYRTDDVDKPSLRIPTEVFFKLIDLQKCMRLGTTVVLTRDEFMETMQIISDHPSERNIGWSVKSSKIRAFLGELEISEDTQKGYRCGEFEVLYNITARRDARIGLRYRDCTISISPFSWKETDDWFRVMMNNYSKC